jgi:HEAT repeat protein
MACAALALLASESKLAVPELVGLLADENSMMRDAASRALWEIDPPTAAATVLPMRIKYLGNANPYVRAHNAYELGNLGPRAAPAVPALQALLNDPEKDVQSAAATALKQIDPAAAK